jgi:carboxypeptidase T
MKHLPSFFALAAIVLVGTIAGAASDETTYWMKVKATDKYERSRIANTGAVIEITKPDYVIAFGSPKEMRAVKRTGLLQESFIYDFSLMDFPNTDSKFNNYGELLTELKAIADAAPEIVSYEVVGKSVEGRDLVALRISTDLQNSGKKPGIIFLGTHHAREHISTEMPLMLAQYLVSEYKANNPDIVKYIENREITILPLVNPDGSEWDVSTGRYKAWRKNRKKNSSGNYGVDLNRNYGYMWGTGGSSKDQSSDVYMGVKPFSEPETTAVKDYIDAHTNITTLLTFHTFSELILYPWGHKYDSIETARDLKVHQTMAETMAKWNGYTPQQASDLYIASGDTTDWAYGSHKIISFTFELDPKNAFGTDGFYPGQAKIPVVFNKNLKPALYLIEFADNPYRVIDGNRFGTSLVQ